MKEAIILHDWHLVHQETNQPVLQGDVVADEDGNKVTIHGGIPPHKPDSTGFVLVSPRGAKASPNNTSRFYVGVFKMKWVRLVRLSWFQCEDLNTLLNKYLEGVGQTKSHEAVNLVDVAEDINVQLKPYV